MKINWESGSKALYISDLFMSLEKESLIPLDRRPWQLPLAWIQF
jgi:hypothetical protein